MPALIRLKSAREVQVALARAARSNAQMADLLSGYQGAYGSWRTLLTELENYQALTQDDLMGAARACCTASNSFEAQVLRA